MRILRSLFNHICGLLTFTKTTVITLLCSTKILLLTGQTTHELVVRIHSGKGGGIQWFEQQGLGRSVGAICFLCLRSTLKYLSSLSLPNLGRRGEMRVKLSA